MLAGKVLFLLLGFKKNKASELSSAIGSIEVCLPSFFVNIEILLNLSRIVSFTYFEADFDISGILNTFLVDDLDFTSFGSDICFLILLCLLLLPTFD